MQWTKQDNKYMVVLRRGEKLLESLKLFVSTEHIQGGVWWGIGAVDNAELATYDVEAKQYHQQTFTGAMEVTHVSGTIGVYEQDVMLHGHMTVIDEHFEARGGHIMEAHVSGVMEIYIEVWPRLSKAHDGETGLKIFSFDRSLS